MEVSVSIEGNVATFAVNGSLNTNTAPELEGIISETFAENPSVTSAVFDFTNLEYISSAGLRVLMVAYKTVAAKGGAVSIEGASDEVQEVFDITGFSDLFNG